MVAVGFSELPAILGGAHDLQVALIVCPECGKEFSDRAAACPHCGCPNDSIAEGGVDLAEQQRQRIAKAARSTNPDVVAGKGAQVTKVVVNNNGCGSGCLKAIWYVIVFFFVLGAIGSIVGEYEDSSPPSRIEKSR